MKLSCREIATILAALREWQEHLDTANEPVVPLEDFAEGAPLLTTEEIDELCTRLNFEERRAA